MTMRPVSRHCLTVIVMISAVFATSACGAKEVAMPVTASLSVEDVFGYWQVSGSGAPTSCRLTLDPILQADRLPASVTRCAPSIVASATSWRITPNGFDLLTKGNEVLIRFHRIDVDRFEGKDASEQTYRLDRAPMA